MSSVPTTADRQLNASELSRFFSVLAHDLKSPIFSIDGFSDLLLLDYAGKIDPEGEDFLRRIRSSAQQMKKVLDDMCHIVKLLGRPLQMESVDVPELVEELRLRLNNLIDEGGTRLVVNADGVTVESDREILKEAIGALLKNAAFFNDRPGGEKVVEFTAQRTPEGTRFTVRDNGIGIDPRYQEQIFDLGIKLDKSRGGGPGYGLFLARKSIETLGGTLDVSSAPDEGSTFTFTLP